MQTTSNATLFQTSYSEALGAYRARKAVHTSGLVSSSSSSSSDTKARYGYPIHLHPNFAGAVINNPDDLAVEGSGADGGRYRILSMQVDQDGWIWTSESGGVVRQVDAESGGTVAVYKGAKAPVPSFDFVTTEAGERLLVTGSWDKAVRVYRVASARADSNTGEDGASSAAAVQSPTPVLILPNAMSDFIKCVHVFTCSSRTYIATAGSDKSIMIWDATPLVTLSPTTTTTSTSSLSATTLRSVHQSKAHLRPINALASLVGLDGTTRLYSADSMGRILESTLDAATQRLEVQREIQGFATAVYDLKAGWRRVEVETGDASASATDAFVSPVDEDQDGTRFQSVAEIWAASGDKSAAGYRLSSLLQPNRSATANVARSTSTQPILGRHDPLATPYVKIAHDDFVKAVLPLGLYLSPSSAEWDEFASAVITGGSDEHVRMFAQPSSPDAQVTTVEAHWHEVSALAVYIRRRRPPPPPTGSVPTLLPDPATEGEAWLVSSSLDGSLRRFALSTIAHLPKPDLVRPSADDHSQAAAQQWDRYSVPPPASGKLGQDPVVAAGGKGGGGVQMTAEEEAELAALMDSDIE